MANHVDAVAEARAWTVKMNVPSSLQMLTQIGYYYTVELGHYFNHMEHGESMQ